MHAYKVKGTIDQAGYLIVSEPIHLAPGEVEIIILQPSETAVFEPTKSTHPTGRESEQEVECSIPILKEWLDKTKPVPLDFDADQAKWEYLKEKFKL